MIDLTHLGEWRKFFFPRTHAHTQLPSRTFELKQNHSGMQLDGKQNDNNNNNFRPHFFYILIECGTFRLNNIYVMFRTFSRKKKKTLSLLKKFHFSPPPLPTLFPEKKGNERERRGCGGGGG